MLSKEYTIGVLLYIDTAGAGTWKSLLLLSTKNSLPTVQTLPDNYTEGVPKTRRYEALGNGWTVDVIAHILSYAKDLQRK